MSRIRVSTALVLFVLVTPLMAKSHIPKKHTHAAIKTYVQQAATFVAKKGADCAALNEADWSSGDYYIFVMGPDDKTLCHPTLVNAPASSIVDANGKKVGDLLVEAAKKKGGGWVEYVWPRPNTTNPVPKSSYAVRVKGPDGKWYVVGSGGYELK